MLTFQEAILSGGWILNEDYISKMIGDIELCLEPLLFDEQFYLAAYDKDKNLLFEKIPIKPGKV